MCRYKCLQGNIMPHLKRLSQNPVPTIKTPFCNSTIFQASYFNRIVKLWDYTCKILPSTSFASLSSFKKNVKNMYKHCLEAKIDIDMPCTYLSARATNRNLTEILYCIILTVFILYILYLSNVCCIVTVSTLHGT